MLKAADLIRELEQAQKKGELLSIYEEAMGKKDELRQVLEHSVSLSLKYFNDLLRKLDRE